jgi:hypothetical protein
MDDVGSGWEGSKPEGRKSKIENEKRNNRMESSNGWEWETSPSSGGCEEEKNPSSSLENHLSSLLAIRRGEMNVCLKYENVQKLFM